MSCSTHNYVSRDPQIFQKCIEFWLVQGKKYFLYTILLLGFISTQCLIDITPITV
jgi:hypothetical protein